MPREEIVIRVPQFSAGRGFMNGQPFHIMQWSVDHSFVGARLRMEIAIDPPYASRILDGIQRQNPARQVNSIARTQREQR